MDSAGWNAELLMIRTPLLDKSLVLADTDSAEIDGGVSVEE